LPDSGQGTPLADGKPGAQAAQIFSFRAVAGWDTMFIFSDDRSAVDPTL
jgi:hypothetical protein